MEEINQANLDNQQGTSESAYSGTWGITEQEDTSLQPEFRNNKGQTLRDVFRIYECDLEKLINRGPKIPKILHLHREPQGRTIKKKNKLHPTSFKQIPAISDLSQHKEERIGD